MRFLNEFHSNSKLACGSNCTFITLTPKVDSPPKQSKFRPISLISYTYKVLANRLWLFIDNIIFEAQSAFIKGRQILDGIVIANEVVGDAKKLKNELIMFKVDFKKAYDSVEYEKIGVVLEQ